VLEAEEVLEAAEAEVVAAAVEAEEVLEAAEAEVVAAAVEAVEAVEVELEVELRRP
jgi:hypothetical protein